jgi:integral membrane protein
VKPAVLTFYRIMAYVTAILLIVLCAAVVLKYTYLLLPGVWPEGSPTQQLGLQGTMLIGVLHGNLYIVYLFVALVASVQLKVPWGRMVLVLLAGTIPFGAFVAERKVTHWHQLRQQGLPIVAEDRADTTTAQRERSASS